MHTTEIYRYDMSTPSTKDASPGSFILKVFGRVLTFMKQSNIIIDKQDIINIQT